MIVCRVPKFERVQTRCRPKSPIDYTVQFFFGFAHSLDRAPTVMQDLGLDLQEVSLNGGGSADAP